MAHSLTIGRESTPVTSYSNGVSVTQTRAKNPVQGAGKSTSVFGAAPPWLNAPVVAAAAAVLILLGAGLLLALNRAGISAPPKKASQSTSSEGSPAAATPDDVVKPDDAADRDRKSTRLNSSH